MGEGAKLTPLLPEKTTFKNPSLIRVNIYTTENIFTK